MLIFEATEPGFPVDQAVRIYVQFERVEEATKVSAAGSYGGHCGSGGFVPVHRVVREAGWRPSTAASPAPPLSPISLPPCRPRPCPPRHPAAGARLAPSRQALIDLQGRFFGGREVEAAFFDEARFEAQDLAPRPDEVRR